MKTLLALALTAPLLSSQAANSWMTWRGDDGLAVSKTGNPPVTWSEEENVRWKVPMPGIGNSSPIVFENRIFVTTAIPSPVKAEKTEGKVEKVDDTAKQEAQSRSGRRRRPRPKPKAHDFFVCAFDRADGREVWRTKVTSTVPHEGGHRTGSLASNSPLTDGKHIYASFGSRGVHCLDLDGKPIWSKQLGTLVTRKGFGEGASPALTRDHLVLNWDHEGDSFLIALDKLTGKEAWRKPRAEATNWSTPLVVDVAGKTQIIVAGTTASRGYDASTGDEIWSCTGLTLNTIPTPVHRGGILYLMGGYQNGIIQAVRLQGAKGDISQSEHVLWRHARSTSYVPSPLLYGEFVYFLRQVNGVLTCLDAATGKVHYESKRLRGVRQIYASPVGAGGRVYLFSRGGTGKVLAAGAEYKELANNTLDDTFDGSPALVEDTIILRGRTSLYCLAEK